ncbi:MAG: DUF2914 domain-containing protein [Deltaproteobacteria bacterium]|nr:DUF2914 domain-containing protein [Deltaproteobacteria bacterium]
MTSSRRLFLQTSSVAALAFLLIVSLSPSASAAVRIVRGQFAGSIEAGRPVGDVAAAGASRATTGMISYFVVASNSGALETLTLEWSVNGRVVRSQTLDVGRAPRWRTWGMHRVGRSGAVSIRVLDAAGTVLHQDTLGA